MSIAFRRPWPSIARSAFVAVLLAAMGAAAAGCAAAPGATSPAAPQAGGFATPLPTLTPPTEPFDIVLAWIECEDECEPLLQAVVELGPEATPILIRTLTEGPPPERLDLMQRHLAQTYEELVAYGRSHPEAPLSIGQEEYFALYLGNYDALYRIRSARALVAIGGPEAFSAIQSALRSAERDDVRQALQQALQDLGS